MALRPGNPVRVTQLIAEAVGGQEYSSVRRNASDRGLILQKNIAVPMAGR